MNKKEMIDEIARKADDMAELLGSIASIETRIITLEKTPYLTRSPELADEEILRARTKRAHYIKEYEALKAETDKLSLELLDLMLGMVDDIADRIEDLLDRSAPAA